MVTEKRWQAAQKYERGYWKQVAERIAKGSVAQLEWYSWRAQRLVRRLRTLGHPDLADGDGRVLEIGSGPIGVIAYLPGKQRFAVDPLEQFYGANPVLTKLRPPAVTYREGVGEALPADSDAFDLVVIENCIDHVQDVDAVMSEVKRVLRANGLLYLTVNCRTRFGFMMHRLLSRFRIDAGHPHTFTPARMRSLLRRSAFDPLHFEEASFAEAWCEDLAGPGSRRRMKALLGVSEYLTTAIATASAASAQKSRHGRALRPTSTGAQSTWSASEP